MWFCPSYGRPESLRRLKDSPGGYPKDVIVIINIDDPRADDYRAMSPYIVDHIDAGSRFTDAWHHVYDRYKDHPWYGMLGDDHIPQTPGWDEVLIKAAGKYCMSYPNGAHTEFPLMRGVCVLGAELVKALGWIVPPTFVHNYVDVVLDQICRDAGLLRPCADVFVDHKHWKFDTSVQQDETYLRGSVDQNEDAQRYYTWLRSEERMVVTDRVIQAASQWRREGLLQDA